MTPSALPPWQPGWSGDVVIYDGHCRFCLAQMSLLRRFDLFGRLTFLSLHDPACDALLPGTSFEERMRAIVVLTPRGDRFAAAHALRYLSRRLPALWVLAPALHLPGSLPLWQRLYDFIARHRYRFGRLDCEGGTCHLHG